jgi:hypothetical protein
MFGDKARTASAREVEKLELDVTGAKSRDFEREVMLADGGMAGVQLRGSQFEKFHAQLRKRMEADGKKDDRIDAFFLHLIQEGNLAVFAAGTIFGGMSDDDINACVAEIEAATGMPFDDYARDILGKDMPEREPGESDADYHRRVLTALGEEMLEQDPDTGELRVKPQYADDPTAQIIKRNETYKAIQATGKDFQAKFETAQKLGDFREQGAILTETRETAEKRYAISHGLDQSMESEQLSDVTADVRDEQRSEVLYDAGASDESSSELAGILGVDPITPAFETAAKGEELQITADVTTQPADENTPPDPPPIAQPVSV